ncbi:MAG TPA: DNA mismatch endonuclease Vsr [Solirubrobacteraceae bacterium]|jgi:DNA (cytosine-5)-methyltransferase 1|nr:DNA mismatch endonuclease Vsr [Solirubrobacteraceae bacterium]
MPVRDARGPLRAIDLFCGAGGLSAGFRSARYEIGYALDHDPDAVATYRHNQKDVPVECVSITDRTPKQIGELAGGRVDVIVGGPSCQTFSTAGRKNGWVRKGDPRNDLWRQMLALVEHLEPKAFLLENVPGMMYWKKGEFGGTVLEEFRSLGYAVSKQILLAADYGVPQRRRRLFVVGLLGDVPFEFPAPTHLGGWRRDYLELWEKRRRERGLLRHIRSWEAIGDLPDVTSTGNVTAVPDPGRLSPFARRMRGGRRTGVITGHTPFLISTDHLELIRHVPQGGTWRDIPRHLLPDRYRGMRRTDSTNLFGRLAPDLPAYTVTTQFDNVTTGCFTHPYHDRALTAREAARLQTFPDRYEFTGGRSSVCRQIGNAVPPLLAHVLASAIADAVLAPHVAAELHPAPKPIRPATALPAPPASDKRTQKRMKGQARRDTKPEVLLRKALTKRGLRYRVDHAPLAGVRCKADVVFPRVNLAVFVHGCFWHGCPEHARPTKSNTKWWADKIAANHKRDVETTEKLLAAGWQVERVWEHEAPTEAADRIAAIVSAREERIAIAAG